MSDEQDKIDALRWLLKERGLSNLRWLEKPDGSRVLQQLKYLASDLPQWQETWEDVPTVKELRKAREWWIKNRIDTQYVADVMRAEFCHAKDRSMVEHNWIRVREVLPEEK